MLEIRHSFSAALLGMALLGCALPARAATTEAAASLQPYTATYEITWHGITLGNVTYTLKQLDAQRWVYTSRAEARGLARLKLPGAVTQRSEMRVTDAGVQPLSFDTDDGGANSERTSHLEFDWNAQHVRGTYEQTKVDMALRPGVQDDISVQVALMWTLARGQTPSSVSMVNKNSIRDYVYLHEGPTTLDTPVGRLNAEIYHFQRVKSPRETRFWCAPSLGYLPVRAEQRRGTSVEWTMSLLSMQR